MEQILPVIVGGLIGLAGGIVGPPLAHWLNEGSSNKKKHAEKLEEMIGILYLHQHWLNSTRSIRMFGKEVDEQPPPLPKAQAICVIYFPEFADALAELETRSDAYELWMLKAAQKRLAGDINNLNDGMDEVYRPYAQQFFSVISTLKAYAKAQK